VSPQSITTGPLQAALRDVSGTLQVITFLSTTEKHALWQNLWLAAGVSNPSVGDGNGGRFSDFDDFPGRNGTYEQAIAALASMRAG
jgi:hypothetical protein